MGGTRRNGPSEPDSSPPTTSQPDCRALWESLKTLLRAESDARKPLLDALPILTAAYDQVEAARKRALSAQNEFLDFQRRFATDIGPIEKAEKEAKELDANYHPGGDVTSDELERAETRWNNAQDIRSRYTAEEFQKRFKNLSDAEATLASAGQRAKDARKNVGQKEAAWQKARKALTDGLTAYQAKCGAKR